MKKFKEIAFSCIYEQTHDYPLHRFSFFLSLLDHSFMGIRRYGYTYSRLTPAN